MNKIHSERTYTFVVDYGQNMELPVFNSQQAGATYYFSPMKVNNLGMVDHAHKLLGAALEKSLRKNIFKTIFSQCNLVDMVCRMNIHQDGF